MAKSKKQEKPIEQRLEEALVLYEKTPYELPSNWCWVKFKSIADFGMGQTILSKELKQEGVPIYSASADGEIFGYINSEDNRIKLSEGDFVIAARGTIGSIKFISAKEACCTQTTMYMKPYNKEISKYLYYAMRAFSEKIFVATGATIPQLTISSLDDKMIPLAPFEEQKRIVEIIEKQFAKLDEARDLIQKSLDSFADRKFSILHKAFTGELTKKWREQRGIDCKWRTVSLNDVSHSFQYGTSKKSEKQGKCIVVRMGNLQQGKIDWNDLVYTNDEEDIQKYRLKSGDVLFNRTNSADLVGKTSIFESDRLAIFAGYLIRINYRKELLLGRFLNYLLNSMKAKEYCMAVKSDAVNQSNINAKKLAAFTFDLPGLDEQEEIVWILDSIFEKEDKSKELIDMLDKIDEMKKSILARAFRGKLGTSNPTDEPATDLLRKILDNQENTIIDKKQNKSTSKKVLPFNRNLNSRLKKICELLLDNDGLSLEELAQGVGKDVRYFFDDIRELLEKQLIKLVDNRYWLNANN